LNRISKDKLPLMAEENKLSAEIGPIKYIAEMFYDKEDPSFIDKAVRAVILIIIVVFDPLAVLLLIAANQTYRKMQLEPEVVETKKTKAKKTKRLDNDTSISIESFFADTNNEVIPKNKITNIDGEFK